jgi:hypothetical protein
MARYTAIPEIPLGGISDWMFAILSTMKQNVDLLTGQLNESDAASQALTHTDITANQAPPPGLTSISATGAGYTIQGVQVPSLTDHVAVISDLQKLAVDVASLRNTVNALIQNLKG